MPETWRLGRKSGHNIYLQTGEQPSDTDRQIGVMFDPEHAAQAVAAVNTGARCPSCDHLAGHHQPEGCWYAVTAVPGGTDLVCPCILPRIALDAPHSPAEPVSPVSTPTEARGETGEAQEGSRG